MFDIQQNHGDVLSFQLGKKSIITRVKFFFLHGRGFRIEERKRSEDNAYFGFAKQNRNGQDSSTADLCTSVLPEHLGSSLENLMAS